MRSPDRVTQILTSESDQADRMEQLLPIIYDKLRELAHSQLRYARPDHTLNTAALVHEAYLKLARPGVVSQEGRAHFFGAAARALRQILVDYARIRNRTDK